MLANDECEALEYGAKALAIVRDAETRAKTHALNNIGAAQMMNHHPGGVPELKESYEIAQRLGLSHDAARACVNLAWGYLWIRDLDRAETWIVKGQQIMARAEMPAFESYAITIQALLLLFKGQWDDAEELCGLILDRTAILGTSRATTLMVTAKLSVRRGLPDAAVAIDMAVEKAVMADEIQRTAPAAEVVAEYIWMGGEVSAERKAWAIQQLDNVLSRGADWNAGELAQWLYLSGLIDALPTSAPDPYRLLASGSWSEASQFWKELGLPYERAVALSLGDHDARIEAIRILDDLGAVPLANRIRSALQSEGVKGVPRGPQRTTRDNPLGLTSRQQDVLGLIDEGLSNAEIADRLFISNRTVDHHVSAILSKLGASSRGEAADLAREIAN